LYYNDPENSTRGTFFTDENFLSIPAGGTDTQNSVIEVSGLDAGIYDLYFYADPTCLTAEANEDNNAYGPVQVTVGMPVTVYLAGNHVGDYYPGPVQSLRPQLGYRDGPLQVLSPSSEPILTSQRSISGNGFFEVMGIPSNQIATDYWFSWYDDILMRTWLVISNASSTTTANVEVHIAGNVHYYAIPPNGRVGPRLGYRDGPMRVVSTNGVPIMTSQRTLFGARDDLLEIFGTPANQITSDYWYPWYDDYLMQTWVVISNASTTQTANVEVRIAGNVHAYQIPPGGRVGPRLGYRDGPMRVISTNGVPILTSQRTLSGDGVFEVKGIPSNQIRHDYWYPWYDDQSMQSWLVISNTSSTQTANVEVQIAGNVHTYEIPAGGRIGPRLGYDQGPLRVVSTNSVPILTSQRVLFGPTSDLFEIFGMPYDQVTGNYWYPWYDDILMQSQLIMGTTR
jgi:hypothetical protein